MIYDQNTSRDFFSLLFGETTILGFP
jgi:hypothetical protein